MTDEELTGPECDWCGAEPGPRNDLDVYGVDDEFVCEECLAVAKAGPRLLAACKAAKELLRDLSHRCPAASEPLPLYRLQILTNAINYAEGRSE